ncbi:MAG TPA: hypothetical protein VGN86_03880 [Pyrinomonadaceae bacterium]|nr:hypothetical protein [Pyrinomonadaceae bacterium]
MAHRNQLLKYIVAGIVTVIIHLIIAIVHGVAHRKLGIELSFLQKLFVISIITVAPILAMILLPTRAFVTGAALLVFSLTGSLLFGILYHFVIHSNDHVFHLPASRWKLPFQITAVLLALSELVGLWIGAQALLIRDKVDS